MSFPINPIAGQKTTQNGIIYAYSTSTNSWRRDFNNVLDQLTIAGTYSSTSTTTGALTVAGGVGIDENLNVAGQLNIKSTLNALSINTGALTVAGGIGINKDLWVGGTIYQNGLPISETLFGWFIISTNYNANPNNRIFVDTSAGTVTITLPADPKIGDNIAFVDYAGTCGTNVCTINRNGKLIMGLAENLVIDISNAANTLIYSGSSYGWKIGAVI